MRIGADVLAADDGNPTTVAPMSEMDVGLRRLTEETYRKRGGKGETLPGFGAIAGRGRVDLRFAMDDEGELYILTKSDGMIRKVVGARVATTAPPSAASVPARGPGQNVTSSSAAILRNPVASTPASIAAGKRVYDANCAACHGNRAQGAVKAGITISIIEEQRGKQPPDLTDDQWDHGSSDGDDLPRDQARAPADHDGGIRWTHSGPGDLEHRQLPSQPPYDVEVNTNAAAALFVKIGPGILVTHSSARPPSC